MTPTREQVVQWAEQSGAHHASMYDKGMRHWRATGEDLKRFAALARADLEATVKEQAAEIERIKDEHSEFIARLQNEECGRTFVGEPVIEERPVPAKQYMSAVNGRREFRSQVMELRQQLAAAQLHNEQLREFVKKVAEQTPEKPDYWSSCSQCQGNSNDAEDLITTQPDLSALEADRQRVAEACADLSEGYPKKTGEHDGTAIGIAIRAGQWKEYWK